MLKTSRENIFKTNTQLRPRMNDLLTNKEASYPICAVRKWKEKRFELAFMRLHALLMLSFARSPPTHHQNVITIDQTSFHFRKRFNSLTRAEHDPAFDNHLLAGSSEVDRRGRRFQKRRKETAKQKKHDRTDISALAEIAKRRRGKGDADAHAWTRKFDYYDVPILVILKL